MENIDRISNLPLHLHHQILSYLAPQDMVQTSLLSTNWKNIWCSAPDLELYEDLNGQFDFYNFVDCLLLLRDGESKVRKFLLNSLNQNMSKINAWIMYALRHNVEVLDLNVWYTGEPRVMFTQRIFCCESLRELILVSCKLNVPVRICLPALKVLKLDDVIVQDGQIFSGMYSLETLILYGCRFQCSVLNIANTQLKNLEMGGSLNTSVVISAPSLLSLELNVDNSQEKISFYGDLVSLTDAIVNITQVPCQLAIQLFCIIKNAQSLLLTMYDTSPFIKELHKDLAILNRVQVQYPNLKWLKILTMFNNIEFISINHILKHAPALESLFLMGFHQVENLDYMEVWSKYELSHLKLVEIHGFEGTKGEVKMLEFFLENAVVLEKLVITVAEHPVGGTLFTREMMKIGRKILSCPRASSSVGILFAPFCNDGGRGLTEFFYSNEW
ncbi:hypothetical protein ACHQM5_020181 [Ranunculus cassubicifolius]